jgi:spore germination protein YaaH
MNLSFSTSRLVLGAAACLALVTSACGGGSGDSSDTGGSAPVASGNGNPPTGTPGTTAPSGDGSTAPPSNADGSHSRHIRCAWIGADTFAAGKAQFLADPDYYDAIHPVWYTLTPDGTPKSLASIVDDADLLATARAHGVKVIPLIDGNTDSYMRTAMASSASIEAHAKLLAGIAQSHNYDGLEMDYEHLWSASDRGPYPALVAAVAAALHAEGKVLTLAVPSLYNGNTANGYDYAKLQQSADVIHLMGYDFHYLGADHLGPIAPRGWIQDVVTYVQSLGAPEKYSLGIANYGIGSGWYTTGKDALARCQPGTYTTQTNHMTVCSFGHQEAGAAPHCSTSKGDVWFEDATSAAEKAQLAKAHGLGGVAYYTLGEEPAGFLDALAASY